MSFFKDKPRFASFPDAGKTTSRPKKLKDDGPLPTFNTNYRPYGGREMPSGVTKGDPFARQRNDYGKKASAPVGLGDMLGMVGMFGGRRG